MPAIDAAHPGAPDDGYELKISRLTIDKLGVKLYDRVSAVVAELVANSYDADATQVAVELPLATLLSVQTPLCPSGQFRSATMGTVSLPMRHAPTTFGWVQTAASLGALARAAVGSSAR